MYYTITCLILLTPKEKENVISFFILGQKIWTCVTLWSILKNNNSKDALRSIQLYIINYNAFLLRCN